MSSKEEYFKLVSTQKGERYFKVDWINNTCIQVVMESGTSKQGRPNMIGVYNISVVTFKGNFYWMLGRSFGGKHKMNPIDYSEFKKAIDTVILKLIKL